MAVKVDPPENFLDQFKEGIKWVNEDGTLTNDARYHLDSQFRFDHDLWERTGGSNDTVSDVESINSIDNAVLGQIANLLNKIDELNSQITKNRAEFAIILKRLECLELQQ